MHPGHQHGEPGVERHRGQPSGVDPSVDFPPIDILFLCTGNICRSPMAEALLRHHLDARGIPSRVHSAGVLRDGDAASGHGVDILRERGIVLDDHRSRRMTLEMIRGADLVLGMAREHVRESVVLAPETFGLSFTLKEIVRRGSETGPRAAGQSFEEWLAKVHAGRQPSMLMGSSRDDDVADPYGLSRDVYERTAEELDLLVLALVDLAWGSV
ncbi:MAG TPA: hypothetical protein VMY34_11275 [Acidimicrobiales bacterium]|nr:hypothetical protein [Acidimicrobiales bacterium]